MNASFIDEFQKIALAPGFLGSVGNALKSPAIREHGTELAGLGILAAPGLDTLQARARARLAGDKSPGGAEKRQLMGETGHALADVGGLGVLMGPEIAKLKHAGFLNSLKNVAMTDIPGTKPWVLGNAATAAANTAKGAVNASNVTKQLGNGVYDVSHMARKMGLS